MTSNDEPAKTWGGRFRKPMHPLVADYGASIALDSRLYRQDIAASVVHARMLGRQGIISEAESAEIVAGLQRVLAEFENGGVTFRTELEDIHTHVEARLKELIGDTAGRLHTARSRNDQIATDLRLFVRDCCDLALERLRGLRRTLARLARQHASAPMPGFTHLQHAQPVTLGHHLLAYADMLGRDRDRLAACRKRANVLPLGSGALAGSPYPLDREWVAAELGFDSVSTNSLDAVSDRDFAAEFVFCAALAMVHVSRLAEEIVLWASPEFAFVELDDAFSTGSSIMPQKKNPDPLELARGKTALVVGNLTALLALLKGLPLSYNRDLQEDKRPLIESADILLATLELLDQLLPSLRFRTAEMRRRAAEGFSLATDIADYLVKKGMPFRKAHEVVGALVQYCEGAEKGLEHLTLAEFRRFSNLFESDVLRMLTVESGLEARAALTGSAAPQQVLRQADAILAEGGQ